MRRDRIEAELVQACLDTPEVTTATIKGRTNYWRRHNIEYLRVTAIEEADAFVIISVATGVVMLSSPPAQSGLLQCMTFGASPCCRRS